MISLLTPRGVGIPALLAAGPWVGKQASLVTGLPITGDDITVLDSPPMINGDVRELDQFTAPTPHAIAPGHNGVDVLLLAGDTSRQLYLNRVFSQRLRQWYESVEFGALGHYRVYVNNAAPETDDDPYEIVLPANIVFGLSLLEIFNDAEGDVLTGALISGAFPAGTVDTLGIWNGTPSTPGTGTFDYQVTDITGASATRTINWTVAATVVLPNKVNVEELQAIADLEALFLLPYVSLRSYSDTFAFGRVMSMNPPATTVVTALSEVQLEVSRGPAPTIVGNTTVRFTPAATLEHRAARGITSNLTARITPQAILQMARSYRISGNATVALTPAANLVRARPRTITGNVAVTLRPQATVSQSHNRSIVGNGRLTFNPAAEKLLYISANASQRLIQGNVTITLHPASVLQYTAGSLANAVFDDVDSVSVHPRYDSLNAAPVYDLIDV